MSSWQALALLIILWAGIYLPGLGTTEIKGEEGRRILPAIGMLESGDWVVPRLNGEPYLRKPPLASWAIAFSMKLSGKRDEWAARLPSVLGVLALGMVTVMVSQVWLRTAGALMAALFMITSVSMIEKGRLAEIEALYVSLSGMALVWWIAWNREGRSRWAMWIVAWVLLALGVLTKGPLHLVYFYAVIGAILFHQRRLRELFRLPHCVAITIGLGIVLLWLIPYLGRTSHGEVAETWKTQMVDRITENEFDLDSWLLSVPRGLSNFLPWTLLIPILWRRELMHRLPGGDLAILRGGRFAVVACFAFLLVPGFLVRYSMPLLVPASLLLALVLQDSAPSALIRGWRGAVLAAAGVAAVAGLAGPYVSGARPATFGIAILGVGVAVLFWWGREWLGSPISLTVATGIAMVLMALIYATAALPRVVAAGNVRPVAAKINRCVPDAETLYAYNLDYRLEMFYLERVAYIRDLDQLPADLRWMVIRRKKLEKVRRTIPGATVIREFGDDSRSLVLIEVRDVPAESEQR